MPRAVDYLKSAGIVLCFSIYRQRRWLRATFCFWKLNSSMLLILLQYRWHVFGVIKPSIIVNKYNGIRIPDQIMPLLHCRIWGQARTTIHSKETELEAMYVQSHNSSSSYIVNCNKKHKTIIFPTCSNCNKNKNAKSAAYLRNDLVFMYTTELLIVQDCTRQQHHAETVLFSLQNGK